MLYVYHHYGENMNGTYHYLFTVKTDSSEDAIWEIFNHCVTHKMFKANKIMSPGQYNLITFLWYDLSKPIKKQLLKKLGINNSILFPEGIIPININEIGYEEFYSMLGWDGYNMIINL